MLHAQRLRPAQVTSLFRVVVTAPQASVRGAVPGAIEAPRPAGAVLCDGRGRRGRRRRWRVADGVAAGAAGDRERVACPPAAPPAQPRPARPARPARPHPSRVVRRARGLRRQAGVARASRAADGERGWRRRVVRAAALAAAVAHAEPRYADPARPRLHVRARPCPALADTLEPLPTGRGPLTGARAAAAPAPARPLRRRSSRRWCFRRRRRGGRTAPARASWRRGGCAAPRPRGLGAAPWRHWSRWNNVPSRAARA